ncbi:hypothetical protein [Lactococcus garvieae]|uniref:hypothetical protein n=1 Tax=Lactococcus garvieae TaxID=1363 RepID=UPI001A904F50|nr:hypothetical protein [Lactococcus garvieae]QSQ99769.1 hypothetical protein J0J34_06700 [Lactococcus garvieae]
MASMTFSIWRLQYEQKKGKLNAYPNKDFFKDLKTFQYKKIIKNFTELLLKNIQNMFIFLLIGEVQIPETIKLLISIPRRQ